MRAFRRLVGAAVVLAICVTLAACDTHQTRLAPSEVPPLLDITLPEARRTQDVVLEEVVAIIPPEDLVEPFSGTTSPRRAMWCDANEGGYVNEAAGIQLPGSASVYVKPEIDLERILEKIATNYEVRSGWRVIRRTDTDGHLQIKMYSPDGFSYLVSYYIPAEPENVWLFRIGSFGPCIPVPDDYNPHEKY